MQIPTVWNQTGYGAWQELRVNITNPFARPILSPERLAQDLCIHVSSQSWTGLLQSTGTRQTSSTADLVLVLKHKAWKVSEKYTKLYIAVIHCCGSSLTEQTNPSLSGQARSLPLSIHRYFMHLAAVLQRSSNHLPVRSETVKPPTNSQLQSKPCF